MKETKEDSFKNAIALTGGIATGKSTVCNLLKLHGFLIIDADKIAHKLLDENSQKIEELFGKQYVENGKVLRKELGKIIFSNEENKLKLEALLHPLIFQKSKKRQNSLKNKINLILLIFLYFLKRCTTLFLNQLLFILQKICK